MDEILKDLYKKSENLENLKGEIDRIIYVLRAKIIHKYGFSEIIIPPLSVVERKDFGIEKCSDLANLLSLHEKYLRMELENKKAP